MKPELIVAIDVPSSEPIPQILEVLPKEIGYYKVGLELFISEGPTILKMFKEQNKKVFLDLKLHDIPRTVERAVCSAADLGIAMLTVHAIGGRAMLTSAAKAAKQFGEQAPILVAVTTLTSLDQDDFKDLGISRTVSKQAIALGELAITSGIDGLVTSVHEAQALRDKFGPNPHLVTPGIRPAGGDVGDQKRVATPAAAINAGSTFLVVGRPILEADNPGEAATQILQQMKDA